MDRNFGKLWLLNISDAYSASLPFCVGSFYSNFEATQDMQIIHRYDI